MLLDLEEAALITRDQKIEQLKQEAEAQAALLTPTEQMIEDIRFEAELIGLSNIEREKRIALMQAGVEAGSAEAMAIEAEIDNLYKLGDAYAIQQYAAESFADAGARAFGSWLDGTESLGDAFTNMAKQMLKEMTMLIIKQAILAAMGQGGGAGGGFSFASAFAGRASGGPVSAGTPYMVGETGRELFIPDRPGKIVPNNQLQNVTPITKNQTTNVTDNLPPTMQRRTAIQTANEVVHVQNRANARNR